MAKKGKIWSVLQRSLRECAFLPLNEHKKHTIIVNVG